MGSPQEGGDEGKDLKGVREWALGVYMARACQAEILSRAPRCDLAGV